MYSQKLLDHFQNPRHAGELREGTMTAKAENPVCGDIVELSARVEDDVIQEIRFRAKGCVPSMACASAVCELSTRMTVSKALGLTSEQLLDHVGGVPPSSTHAVQLALEALHRLLQNGR